MSKRADPRSVAALRNLRLRRIHSQQGYCTKCSKATRYISLSADDGPVLWECGRCFEARIMEAFGQLQSALVEAIEIIRLHHGEPAWEIYYDRSPEMRRLRAALLMEPTDG